LSAALRVLGALDGLTASGLASRVELLGYRALPEARRRQIVARGFRRQARVCGGRGSPLYDRLLQAAAADVEAAGPCWRAVEREQPRRTALPLRFMGAVHRLVLAGDAPALARFYPSAAADPDRSDPWPAFLDSVAGNVEPLRSLVRQGNQTNEVRRCATLLLGFLLVARETGLPLRLLELGASGGLLLRWDRYLYRSPDRSWGDPASPLVLDDLLTGPLPPLDISVEIVERRGCDPSPIDAGQPESALTLRSLVWADQVDRLRMLEAALAVAAEVPVSIEPASASKWLPDQVSRPSPGVVTVVFQSYVQQFYSKPAAARIEAAMSGAGSRSSVSAPLAWLRLEPEGERLELRLRLWPGGEERIVASCSHHGADVRWLLDGGS
jgi:hypothetical protein